MQPNHEQFGIMLDKATEYVAILPDLLGCNAKGDPRISDERAQELRDFWNQFNANREIDMNRSITITADEAEMIIGFFRNTPNQMTHELGANLGALYNSHLLGNQPITPVARK